MRNEPVINEITEDDVNGLTDQIRQLKVLNVVLCSEIFFPILKLAWIVSKLLCCTGGTHESQIKCMGLSWK